MIEARNLTKVYEPAGRLSRLLTRGASAGRQGGREPHAAVDSLDFTVEPGKVTGFIGPNGSGKSTTMRMVVGLENPTSGTVTVEGKPYREHREPLRALGALLDAGAVAPGMTAHQHLRAVTIAAGLPKARCHEVLELVGLESVAHQRAGTFSLGMKQRLGLATALLGDPRTVMLDEPINGLDLEGIVWMRGFLRGLAEAGKAVLVSSHLMGELAATVDHVVVIGKGRKLADASLEEFTRGAAGAVRVATEEPAEFQAVVEFLEGGVEQVGPGEFRVTGVSREQLARTATEARVVLTGLTDEVTSLEDAYRAATREHVRFRS